MKRFLSVLIAVVCACVIGISAKEKVSVLYVGGSPDFNTIGGMPADPAEVAKSAKERAADFTRFLKQRFTKVTAIDGKDYRPEMSEAYDVTVFDSKPAVLRPEVIERDENGRVIRYEKAAYLPDDFDDAVICIAEASENIGRSLGNKNDWFCLCLDNYALGWKKDHPVFNGPFKVNIVSEMRPTPDNAKEYAPMYGYTLPEQTEMWMVSKNGGFENGQRIGMVSRPWGYTDSPEAEVISGGLCAKSIDAVAIGRHGNFFHWGFTAKPSDLTEPAKAALANAIVYMKDFKGKRIIARKLNEGIATRDAATASKYTMSRDCWKEMEAVNMKYYLMMDSTMRAIKAKQAAGEELSPAEMMHLQFPAIPKPKSIPFSEYLKGRNPELYKVFGEDEAEYARYYDKNRPYFRADSNEGYSLEIDQEARALGIANNDIRLLDKAVELLEKGGDDAVTGRTLLERYTLCRFATPAEWKAWLDANRDRMFFSESGGWLWLVDTLDPSVPGNDYSVLTAPAQPENTAPVAPAGDTDRNNPVALKAEIVDAPGGMKDVVITMTVHEGFHTYAYVADEDPFIPTEVSIELPEGYEKSGSLVTPTPTPSSTATTYYTGNGAFRQRIKGNGDGEVVCKVKYQACDASMCMPPVTKTITLAIR